MDTPRSQTLRGFLLVHDAVTDAGLGAALQKALPLLFSAQMRPVPGVRTAQIW